MSINKIPGMSDYPEDSIEEIILEDSDKPDTEAAKKSSADKKSDSGKSISAAVNNTAAAALADSNGTDENKKNTDISIKTIGNAFISAFAELGEYFCLVIWKSLLVPFKLILASAKFVWVHTKVFRDTMKRIGKELFSFVAGPFLRSKRAYSIAYSRIKQARQEGDRKKTVKIFLLAAKETLFGRRGLAVTLFNYAAPIVAVTFLLSVVVYATKTNYAIKLTVNGKFLGYIQSEQVFNNAERIMNERITYMENDDAVIELEPEYSLEMLGDQEYVTEFQLVNRMMEISDTAVEYAYGMYIGDKFYGALVDTAEVQKELERILDSYRTNAKDEDVAFEKEITYEPGLYLSSSIVEPSEIIKLLNSKKTEASYYTIEENDSGYAISEKLGISIKELETLNPEITDEDYVYAVGNKLLKTQEVPFLSVSISRTEEYEVEVPYDTEYTTNDNTYQGVQTIVQEGEPGKNKITAKVYYVNGEEVRRTIKKTERISDPVTKIISEGTLAPQSSHVSTDSVDTGKMFIWPVQGGTFWEWGWWDGGYYGHRGVDIGAPYGNDVYAGAPGTVIFAGWDNGGLGYCVMIQHGADYGYLTTVYAHNSELYVYAGQEVAQGQCIAAIGETGLAYGCHCHFEVRDGSERLNPRYYLSGLPSI